MKVYELRFPIVRYFHLLPSPIYSDKLRRADIGAVSGGGLYFLFRKSPVVFTQPVSGTAPGVGCGALRAMTYERSVSI